MGTGVCVVWGSQACLRSHCHLLHPKELQKKDSGEEANCTSEGEAWSRTRGGGTPPLFRLQRKPHPVFKALMFVLQERMSHAGADVGAGVGQPNHFMLAPGGREGSPGRHRLSGKKGFLPSFSCDTTTEGCPPKPANSGQAEGSTLSDTIQCMELTAS